MTGISSQARRRLPLLLIAALFVLGIAACAETYPTDTAVTPPQTIFQPQSDSARMLLDLFTPIFIVAGVVFVVVEGVLIYAVLRFRRRPGDQIPTQIHGNTRVEVAWTILPAVALAFVAVPTVRTIFATYHPDKTNAVVVRSIGHQWWFEFQYPGLNITTANEVHLPVGQQVVMDIETADVIHAFWFPGLHGKRDMVPGHTNQLAWIADKPGIYYGQCTQLCGTSHANMRMRAVVHDAASWQEWIRTTQAANGTPAANASPDVQAGYQLMTTKGCIACHAVQGTPLQGVVGPNLTRYANRGTLGAGMYENTDENLARWLKNPQEMKPGNKMPNLNLSDQEIAQLVAYLRSLK